jgi:hypothetical protein
VELLGDVGHFKSRFDPFVDGVSRCIIGAHFAPNILLAQESFWMHPMVRLGDVGHVESRFDLFGDGICVGAI